VRLDGAPRTVSNTSAASLPAAKCTWVSDPTDRNDTTLLRSDSDRPRVLDRLEDAADQDSPIDCLAAQASGLSSVTVTGSGCRRTALARPLCYSNERQGGRAAQSLRHSGDYRLTLDHGFVLRSPLVAPLAQVSRVDRGTTRCFAASVSVYRGMSKRRLSRRLEDLRTTIVGRRRRAAIPQSDCRLTAALFPAGPPTDMFFDKRYWTGTQWRWPIRRGYRASVGSVCG